MSMCWVISAAEYKKETFNIFTFKIKSFSDLLENVELDNMNS